MKEYPEDRIWKRYKAMFGAQAPMTRMDLEMTLHYANEDCPLDLEKLEAADDFNFVHDIDGLYRHLNRETLKLENYFLPRCAKQELPTP